MSSIIDRSLARAVDVLGDLVDTQRQEIQGLKNQIKHMTKQIEILANNERLLVDEVKHYKMLVANLETDKK